MSNSPEDFFQEPLDFKKFDIFKTEADNSYLTFNGVTYPLRGSEFTKLLNHLHYALFAFFPPKGDVHEIIDNFDMYVKIYAAIKPIHHRFAKLDDALYIDLGNAKFEAMEITRDYVKRITNPPVKFIRTKIQKSIEAPDTKGMRKDFELLKKYVPFKTGDDFILFVSWLLSCMNTDGGYPPLFLIGEQGSAKSTTTAFVKELLDDSTVPLRNLSRTMKNLMIAASNDFILCYDNISKITDKQSDNICKLATGAGFTTRKLYTTTEEVQLSCKRPAIINSISFIPTRQDLLDRCVVVTLDFIKPEERKTNRELKESWEKDRPLIFGALCNAASSALRNYDQVDEESLPRMADFAKWVIAAEAELPWKKGQFLKTLKESRKNMVTDTIDAEPVAMAVIKLMADHDFWNGTPSALLDKLEDCINQARNKYPKWPKLPNQLTRKLGRVSAFLREKGINIEKRHSGERYIEITKINPQLLDPKPPVSNIHADEKLKTVEESFFGLEPSESADIEEDKEEQQDNRVLETAEAESNETDF